MWCRRRVPDYDAWRPRLAAALDDRFYSIDYLDGLLVTGRAFLWASDAAALVAEIRTYPTGLRALHFLCAAGDLRAIEDDLRPRAEAFGRLNGCVAALIESRPGWVRRMKPHGYTLFQASIVKDL